MTTIAFDGTTLAVDSGWWDGNLVDTGKKLYALGPIKVDPDSDPVEAYAAIKGESAFAVALIYWLRGVGEKPQVPTDKLSASFGILVTKTLRVFAIMGNGTLVPMSTVPLADGAQGGAGVALGAMLMGASAVRAIELAAERTDAVMLPVQSVRLGG